MKVSHIFITHLHGDHIFGLPGFLTSLILMNRKDPLYVFGPMGIKVMIQQIFEATEARFNYEVHFIETNAEKHEIILENSHFSVETIPLKHKIACNGYLFREAPRQQNIKEDIIHDYGLTVDQIIALKNGVTIETSKGSLNPQEALYTKCEPKSYAYCSDTEYLPHLASLLQGVDLLYHEATYMSDFTTQAKERGHSTAAQAAELAKNAGIKKLIIGHPSSKYSDVEPFVKEAKEIFENSEFATEGMTFLL